MQPHSPSTPTKPCHAIGGTFRHSLTKRDIPPFREHAPSTRKPPSNTCATNASDEKIVVPQKGRGAAVSASRH
nr:MAG TPA: hypothetical protein [Caudoviricetes sp.]